jgi:hypothetical protein
LIFLSSLYVAHVIPESEVVYFPIFPCVLLGEPKEREADDVKTIPKISEEIRSIFSYTSLSFGRVRCTSGITYIYSSLTTSELERVYTSSRVKPLSTEYML